MDDQSLRKDLRSVLMSEKDGIEITRLNSEFNDLIGKNIQFDRNRYPTLESFLMTLTDTCRIRTDYGRTIVSAVTSEKQQDLKKLIQGQKSNKKPILRRPLFSRARPISSGNRVFVRRTNTSHTPRYSSGNRYTNSNINSNINSNSNDRRTSQYYGARSRPTRTTPTNQQNSSNDDKVFDVRARNGNTSVKVVESKASDYVKRKSDSPYKGSNNDPSRTPNRNRTPYKSSEIKLKIDIKEDEPVDYKYELCMYAKENNLPEPRYVLSNYVERNKVVAYFSKVQIGLRGWLIYPDFCCRTPDGADRAVAKKCLLDLKASNKIESTISQKDDIVEKISKLFNENESLYSHHIEKVFVTTYNSKLVENWLDLLKESGRFDVEGIQVGNKLMVLVTPSTTTHTNDVSATNLESESQELPESENQDLPESESQELSDGESQELPESLELNRDEDWQVMILRANSREIVLRLTNNIDELDELITDLQKFYNEDHLGERCTNVVINKIYAAVFDDAVFRVQAILQEGNEVHCWFHDDGIVEKILRTNLYEIDSRFMKFPFQAFTVQLDGLTDQSESLTKKFIDDKMKENDDVLCLIARPISFDDPITVRLYDTSNDDKDIDLNEEIIKFIETNTLPGSKSSVPKALLPKLNEEDNEYESIDVKVSLVLNPNNFTVTCIEHLDEGSEYQQFNQQLQEFYSKTDEHVELNESMIYPGLFVCVRDNNLQWYRGRIEDVTNTSKCTAHLVDQGRIVLAEMKNIQPLYSQFLDQPMIAIKASLSNTLPIDRDWDIETIIEFRDLVDDKEFEAQVQDIVHIDGEPILQISLINKDGESVSEVLIRNQLANSF